MNFASLGESLIREEILRLEQAEAASKHPAFLLHFVKCVDSRSGDVFRFQLLTREESDFLGVEIDYTPWDPGFDYLGAWERGETLGLGGSWVWQRQLLEWWILNDQTVVLKGRQLGVTWVACGLALWYLLYRPGVDVLIYSQGEDEAQEVVERIWDMLQSLLYPDDGVDLSHLLNGVKVIRPARPGTRPSEEIAVEHPDGRVTSVQAMPGTKKAGHSRSAALILFDEMSRQEYAREIWKAIVPATADQGGKILGVSTANGAGNMYHELYTQSGLETYPTVRSAFLRWDLHPGRDLDWYDLLPLDSDARAEQYPTDPDEAFLMSGHPFFDPHSLRFYQKRAKMKALFQCEFETKPERPSVGSLSKRDGAPISVYQTPVKGKRYAVGADIATGTGEDFSCAFVIDLSTAQLVAELHTKTDYDEFAKQLHYLGLWFNKARVAPEKAGGYGDTVIAYLRDGKAGRNPYPNLYRYKRVDRPGVVQSDMYGYPMNVQSRPLALAELKKAVREQTFDALPSGLVSELRTFVHRETRPSPRASDGCNDDRVMAAAITLELFREFGEHEHDIRKRKRKKFKPQKLYPWS